jgi:hypothetical protein
MAENSTPHQILRDLLHGSTAFRPLFAPIVFVLGARIENLSLRAFLASPTKISNSLRQTRPHLRSDGVSCYFDPLLEAEALGGMLQWRSDNDPPLLRWLPAPDPGQLPVGLRLPEEIAKSGRIPVALEVIRRLKALLREESLLMAGVSGPFALASRLSGLHGRDPQTSAVLPESALEVATSAIAHASKAFAEAGANLIFLREDGLPLLPGGSSEDWTSMLTPIFNIIRFYEALPVLQIADQRVLADDPDAVLRLAKDSVLCLPLEAIRTLPAERLPAMRSAKVGLALPVSAFQVDQSSDPTTHTQWRQLICDVQPAIVTTVDDVPAATDLKRLAAVSEIVRR